MLPFTAEVISLDHDAQSFFAALGKRISEARTKQGLSQAQLAEQLGVSQQQIAHFELARRRVPASMLPPIAQLLSVSVEELLGEAPKKRKRGPTPKLQQQLDRVAQLPRARQRFVSEMLETVLQQAGR